MFITLLLTLSLTSTTQIVFAQNTVEQLFKQGIFILGGKKEKKSDLLLIKLQKYHYFLSFKIC